MKEPIHREGAAIATIQQRTACCAEDLLAAVCFDVSLSGGTSGIGRDVLNLSSQEQQHLTNFRLHSRGSLTNGAGLSAKVGLQRQQVGLHLGTRCSLSQYSVITTAATEQAESGFLQSLYAVGQQADQLVQHQLTGAPRPLSALLPQHTRGKWLLVCLQV